MIRKKIDFVLSCVCQQNSEPKSRDIFKDFTTWGSDLIFYD